MSTRARVGIIDKHGTITSIYTHWDGYPRHHFPILDGPRGERNNHAHYRTAKRVRELLSCGDCSVLAPNIGCKISFADPEGRRERDQCLFYARDRGDADTGAMVAPNMLKFHEQCVGSCAEYAYLYSTKRSRWLVFKVEEDGLHQGLSRRHPHCWASHYDRARVDQYEEPFAFNFGPCSD